MATESLRVQIDASLYDRAEELARAEGTSVETLIQNLLKERVDEDDADDEVDRVWERMNRSLQHGPDLGFGESRAA